jgi:cell division septum initiation protein DivIVA
VTSPTAPAAKAGPAKAAPARQRRGATPAELGESLAPVADALLGSARRRADAVSAAAERDADAVLARAQEEAERLVSEARAEGAKAGERRAAADVAAARREARGTVLAAQSVALERLRQRAIEVLEQRGDTAAGRGLGDALERLARERVGGEPTVRRFGPGGLSVSASSERRQVAIGPAELVDRAIQALAAEVESLWA